MKNPQDTGTGITPTTEGLSAAKASLSLVASSFGKTETHAYTDGKVTSYISEDKDSDSNAYSKNADLEKETKKTVKAAKRCNSGRCCERQTYHGRTGSKHEQHRAG